MDNAQSTPVATPEAIEAETNRLIKLASERNNLPFETVKAQYETVAREQAVANFEKADADTSNVYRRLYGESQDRIAQLEAQLAATQASRIRNDEHVIVTTAESVQRRDPLAWHKMTIPQRLASVGVDPNVDKAEVARFFGKNSDQKAASDLMRVDQRRYKTLREAARILEIL